MDEYTRTELEKLLELVPCYSEGNAFLPRYSMDGEYIGDENINETAVISEFDKKIRELLSR